MMDVTTTNRGFELIQFRDGNGKQCSIQQSSAIDSTADGLVFPGSSYLWIGVDDASPRIMASEAAEHGVATTETTGWVSFPVPKNVLMTTRMHIPRDQVPDIIATLQRWYDTGSLSPAVDTP